MANAPTTTQTSGKVVEYEEYIDQQIAKTSLHVRVVDVATGVLELGLIVLSGLLALVIIDHWIVGLAFWARLLALVGLVGASIYLLATRVAPPLIRSINPVYAAQTVERSFPVLKNGLINFLFFREQPATLHKSVYQGVQKQAAVSLSQVPIDTAVDRAPIIRLGYVLVVIVTVWCGYLLFSPKNPLQTVSRIATPWREIARPSRVHISSVDPGDAHVFRGESLDVAAEIEGLKADQLPMIEFSTADGQITGQRLLMIAGSISGRYEGVLEPSEAGIQQDLEYCIIAGDAVTRKYQVQASEAPHIVVDRVQYEYPQYTALPEEIVQGEGDIRAIEGTRVTVFGKANQPIRSGTIELFPAVATDVANDAGPKNTTPPKTKSATMTAEGQEGHVRIDLRMGPDRKQSVYRAYRLHFLNEQQTASQDPVEYSIEVTPDIKPIVQILTPSKRTIEIPENGWQKIEIRALDPDFALTRVQFAARTRGRVLVHEDLLSESRSGQVITTYNFVPREHGLQAGDVVEYLGVAEDNRHAPLINQLDPNRSTTAKQFLRIVAAEQRADSPQPQPGQEQPDPNVPPTQEPDAQNRDKPQQPGQQPDQQTPDTEDQQGQDDGSASEQPQTQNEPSQSASEDSTQQQQPGQSPGQPGPRQDGNEGGESEQEDLESGQSGNSQTKPDASQSGDPGSGANDAQGPGGSDTPSAPSGTGDPRDDASDESADNPSSMDNARGARPDEPLPSDGSRDGEVVERVQEYIRQKNASKPSPDSNSKSDATSDPAADDAPEKSEPGAEASHDSDATGENRADQAADNAQEKQENSAQQGTRPESSDSPDGTADRDGSRSPSETPSEDTSAQTPPSDAGAPQDQNNHAGTPSDDGSAARDQDGESATEGQQKQGRDTPPKDQPANHDQPDAGSQQGQDSDGKSNGNQSSDSQQRDPEQSGEPGDQPQSSGDTNDTDGSRSPSEQGDDAPNVDKSDGGNNTTQKDQQRDSSKQPSGDGGSSQEGSPSGAKPSTNKPPEQGADAGDPQPPDESSRPDEPNANNESDTNQARGGDRDPNAKGSDIPTMADGPAEDNQGEPGGDDTNVEYAQKATDLVLEYLRDQKDSTDRKLLDQLGWKQEDVESFLRRWEQLKRNARREGSGDEQGKRRLDDVLRSMGLQPPRTAVRGASKNADRQRGNRETGRRSQPPAEFLEQYRDFLKSLQQQETRQPGARR